jgi:sirohydrochlorin cobaltochelatase
MTALVLAAHGSHISPHTAGLVWSYTDQLRAQGVADEITATFWKETPSLHQVLNTIVSDQIVVVPMFTAAGYFSSQVVPAEMGLEGEITHHAGRTIYYTRTIGEHRSLTQVVRQRIEDVLNVQKLDPQHIAVALIGHGTSRSPESRDATRQQVEALRARDWAAEVVDVYLDDSPYIPSIYTRTQSPVIIAVPFFLAPGSHVTRDVPAALGIEPGQMPAQVNGRQVYYTAPVGTDEVICRVILELARDTGLPFLENPVQDQWQRFPQMGADQILAAVLKNGIMRFGQIQLSKSEVRPVQPAETADILDNPAALRQRVRENPFRPLAVSDDLPTGWRVPITVPSMLPAVVETIYPGALADWAANRTGHFRPGSLRTVSERQAGMFRDIHLTPPAVVENAVQTICGRCVRHATWYYQQSPNDAIPCSEPCNWWLSRVKEVIAI